jgi:CubicO group peptidase (beta-lactamase class C family)
LKFVYITLLFTCFTVNCNRSEEQTIVSNQKVSKPNYHALIDTVKYKNQIFRLDSLFNGLYHANLINANIIIAKGNNVIYKKSFGYSDKQKQLMLNDSSLFQLASVSKVLTAIGVLKLVEKGRLDLDTRVNKIIDGFPYRKITVRHLLSHRSGLPNYTYFMYKFAEYNAKALLTNNDVLESLKKHEPDLYFKPNFRFNYCNTNYAVLASIIEKISGMDYSTYMTKEIFEPLGMNQTTTILKLDSSSKYLTKAYTMSYQKVENDKFDGVLGDKGIISTSNDLLILSLSLYQGKLLSNHVQQIAFKPHSKEKKLSNYGLGWRMKNMDNSEKEVFHNGWWHGYRTAFHRRLKDSLTVIILSNRLNKSVYAIGNVYNAIDGPSSFNNFSEDEE